MINPLLQGRSQLLELLGYKLLDVLGDLHDLLLDLLLHLASLASGGRACLFDDDPDFADVRHLELNLRDRKGLKDLLFLLGPGAVGALADDVSVVARPAAVPGKNLRLSVMVREIGNNKGSNVTPTMIGTGR